MTRNGVQPGLWESLPSTPVVVEPRPMPAPPIAPAPAISLGPATPPAPRAMPSGQPALAVSLTVLSSSSSGNASVLVVGEGDLRRAVLIDCGLSPLRTRRLLARAGLTLDHVDDVLITHFDSDHFSPAWGRWLGPRRRAWVHARHARRAEASGVPPDGMRRFDAPFELPAGLHIAPALLSHDELGVVAFRISRAASGPGSPAIAFATDVGRPSERLAQTIVGADILAIESNYCPELQARSTRPDALKRRIMGGSGHLSNQQCAAVAAASCPRSHVVLLHLSRECNTPERAAAGHAGARYGLTIARPDEPTEQISLAGQAEERL